MDYHYMNNQDTDNISRWSHINNLVLSAFFAAFLFQAIPPALIVSSVLLSFALLWLMNYPFLKEFTPFAGYANWITLFRLFIVSFIGFGFSFLSDLVLFLLAILAVMLDGIDGYVARKTKQKSLFGAYFDMETDAFYVCIMTIILYKSEYLGAWILPVGFLRYLYGALLYILRLHKQESIRTRFGPIIAGILFFTLPSPFVLPENYYRPLLIAASILIIISFTISFLYLLKTVLRKRKNRKHNSVIKSILMLFGLCE